MSIYLTTSSDFDPEIAGEINSRFLDPDRTTYDFELKIGKNMKLRTDPEKLYELLEELIKRNDFDTVYLAEVSQEATLRRVVKTGRNIRFCLNPKPFALNTKSIGEIYNTKALVKAKKSGDFNAYLAIFAGIVFIGILAYVGIKYRKK